MPSDHSLHLQGLLHRLEQGEDAARNELIAAAYQRLHRLAQTLLHEDFPRLPDGTESVLNESVVRLLKALRAVRPPTVRDFFTFSAAVMRRVLIDLARRRAASRRGLGPVRSLDDDARQEIPADQPGDPADGPVAAALWAEFHRRVETLPPDQREVVDLHWYQGLTQAETADLLGRTPKAVSRLWLKALVRLAQWMPGLEVPDPKRG